MKKVKRQAKSAVNLPSLILEGTLFLPDQLEKAALGQAKHQGEADYQTPNEIERVGEVPTEAALINVRSERDAVWQLLRRQWVDGEDVSAEASDYRGEGSLPDAFENHLAGADEVSDRLRREADRVHALASLQAKQEGGQRQADEIAEQLEATKAEKVQLDADWEELWAPCQ